MQLTKSCQRALVKPRTFPPSTFVLLQSAFQICAESDMVMEILIDICKTLTS